MELYQNISDQSVIDLYNQNYNDTQIAEVLGCHRTLIGQRRKKLGLPKIEIDYKTQARNDAILELCSQGLNDHAIAKQLNISAVSLVRNVRLKYGISKALTPKQRTIKELAEAGQKYYEIAEALNERGDYVIVTLNKLGFSVTAEDRAESLRLKAERQKKTTEQLNDELRPFGFEYVSGYKGCDSKVRIRCLKCGHERELWYSFTRKRDRLDYNLCPECERIAREERKASERWKREHVEALRKISAAEQLTLRFGVCKQCGQPFVQTHGSQAFCSDRCRKTSVNRRKDRRLTAANIIDKDITLERLYKRDSGVCYLCGKTCDWTDFIVEDGVTICGDNYPSIEHVEPLSRGGKHSWQNVKLACRGCNTAKSNAPVSLFLAQIQA